MDSRETSLSQIDDSLVQIETKFHDYSMSFIQVLFFSMLKHDMDFGQVQVMEFLWHFLRKWWDVHRIWSHFRPNCHQKDYRNPCYIFHRVVSKIKRHLPLSLWFSHQRLFHFLSILRLNPILAPPNRHVYLILLPVFYFMGLENLLHLHFLLLHLTLHNIFL